MADLFGSSLAQILDMAGYFVAISEAHKPALIEVVQTGLNRLTHLLFFESVLIPVSFHQPQTLAQHLIGVVKLAGVDQIGNQCLVVFAEHNIQHGHSDFLLLQHAESFFLARAYQEYKWNDSI
jgi:hypothetical protein